MKPAQMRAASTCGDTLLPGTIALISYRASAPFAVGPFVDRPTRYSDRPTDWHSRLLGALGTAMVAALILGCALFTWHAVQPMPVPSPPLVLTLQPLAAPPEPVEEVPEGPRQVEQQEHKPRQKEQPALPEIVVPQLATRPAPLQPPVEQARPADPVPETTAPRALPAPPARRASSDTEKSWEALLLAHLEKYRRYPAAARARGAQGVAFVRFRMNRAGTVLAVEIARSSGSTMLDRAAIETIRRAQPLPPIPEDKPDELDLAVPVEFFVRN